ncbi:MAG: hypothetical protein KAW84_03990 [Thermoplasmata archaeon]|nr:hypothetical protein [Thermoplasmata archaeon]
MMLLKKHTHEQREELAKRILPKLREKFGDDLVAFAAQASHARGEDFGYSDLELIAFLKEMPSEKKWGAMVRVYDGMLIELVWTTKETYLKEVKDVTKEWFLAGSDTLLSLMNEEFVRELNEYVTPDLEQKCLKYAANRFKFEVQKSFGKVLNALDAENREGLPLMLFDAVFHALVTLSFLNCTPYVTFARMVERARTFETKPAGLDELLDVVVGGNYRDLASLREIMVRVFAGFEEIFEARGVELPDDDIDPELPNKDFLP